MDDEVTRPGLEPGLRESKSLVLPLHHRAGGVLRILGTYRQLPRVCNNEALRNLLLIGTTFAAAE